MSDELRSTHCAPRFALGRVVATPGALHLEETRGIDLRTLLERHQRGDWGDLCEEDRQANEDALRSGARIFSAYGSGETKVYVITDAATNACPCCFGYGGTCPGFEVGELISTGDSQQPFEHWLVEERRLATTILLPSEY